MANDFIGNWSYRSLINNPDLATPFNDLRFGMGNLVLEEPAAGLVGGTLGGTGWSLNLDGTVTTGDLTTGEPTKVRFQGRGEIGGELWVYDYLGFLAPDWPNAIDQVDAIVGTIIRTEPHGTAPAGFVASWYAVRQ